MPELRRSFVRRDERPSACRLGRRLPPGPARAAGTSLALLLALLVLLVDSPGAYSQMPEDRPGALVGLTLAEAIEQLRTRGLAIVFTDELVRPEMRVEREPLARDARAILEAVLSQHGLAVSEARDGTLVVVSGAPGSELLDLSGTVLDRETRSGIPGARVRIAVRSETSGANAHETDTSLGGRFTLSALEPGGYTLVVDARGYALQELPIELVTGQEARVEIPLLPMPFLLDEIVVRPSRLSLLRESPAAPLALRRGEIAQLPHLGDDVFRAMPLLPGLSANDYTARFRVHGGRRDEVEIRLDGLELYDAFHLKDFDEALSVVSSDSLESAEISTGGWAADRGDRMSAVLDLRTRRGGPATRNRLALSLLTASASSSGGLGDDLGDWLVQGRTGSITLASRLLGEEDPTFFDLFGRMSRRFGERHTLRANLLWADDELTFEEFLEEQRERTDTEYSSRYLWGSHDSLIGDRLSVQTTVGWSAVDRDRRGSDTEEEQSFAVTDLRDFDVLELRSEWSLWTGARHAPGWGVHARRYSVDYDYFNATERDEGLPVIPPPRIEAPPPDRLTRFAESLPGNHFAGWITERMKSIDPLTLDLGLRVDHYSWIADTEVSPRLGIAWRLGERSVLRAAWGFFHQSQRPYELEVQDGERQFSDPERSEHWVLGYERAFAAGPRPWIEALRVEAFAREIDDPRPRYENLFEPYNVFPEVELDRVAVVPEDSRSHGIELLLRGAAGRHAGWWANYSLSRIEDRLDGDWVRRQTDQRHALNLAFELALGPHWRLSTAWRYHTGWPTTPVTLVTIETPEGEDEPALLLDDLNSSRVSDYHRLDLRLSRRWQLRRGELLFFVDVQNLYDRANVAGFDYSLDDDERLEVDVETWAGILPSLGVSWEF